MKNKLLPVLVAIGVTILACDVTVQESPSADAGQLATWVAATLTAMTAPEEEDSPGATLEELPAPSETPLEPTLTPTVTLPPCLPAHPGAQALPLPAALAGIHNEIVTFFNLQAAQLATRPVAGMTFPESGYGHVAGNLGMGNHSVPLLFYTLQGGGTIRQNINNSISDLVAAPNLSFLTGTEGGSYVVWTTLDMMNQNTNRLYAGNLAQAPGLQPLYTWAPQQNQNIGNAIQPLAVNIAGGQARGIWFTYTMIGIGNINFPPLNGLMYLNLQNNQPVEYLAPSNALGGISPDQTRIAFGAGQGGTPGFVRNGLTIRDLITCQEVYIAFNASSNLGGGFMTFSPDNQMIAWVESSGANPMEASFRLRVARTDGASLFDSPFANLTSFAGGEAPQFIKTVGWMANHLLVMQLYLNADHPAVLVVWAPDPAQPLDPALGANQSVAIGDGQFLGFVYP